MRFCTRRIMGKEKHGLGFFLWLRLLINLLLFYFLHHTPHSAYGQEPVCGQHLLHPPGRTHPSLFTTFLYCCTATRQPLPFSRYTGPPLEAELTDATSHYSRTPTTNQRPAQLPTHQVLVYRNHSTSHPHVPAANSPPASLSASKPQRPPKPPTRMQRTHRLSRSLIHYPKNQLSSSLLPQRRKLSCAKLACTSATTRADSVARSAAMRIPRMRSLSLVARVKMRVGLGVDRVRLRRRRDDRWTMRTMLLMLGGTGAVTTTTSS
jgi:hypothetical protein